MRILSFILFLLLGSALCGQEICDDAIDNDGDGLIDLNDTEDCICETAIPSGLIPNPSFEEFTQCPFSEQQLNFAVSWIQASAATSDFIHTCGGFLGNEYANNAIAPQPFPDGDGCIGFRDGNGTRGLPNFKEYVGSALTEPMKAGTTYKLDFFVGFHDHPSSVRFPMAVFLTDVASNLPFGGNDSEFGCPTNGPGWDLIGELVVEGSNEWVNVEFEFTPTKDYEAIVLGPGCAQHPDWAQSPYFFMDRLVLAELTEFNVPTQIFGDICDDELTIELQEDQLGYQWYYEGVALIGQTSRTLELTGSSPLGNYIAVVETPEGCFLSDNYNLAFPDQEYPFEATICEGESYEFAGEEYFVTGTYADTIAASLLCDSISILNLVIERPTEGSLSDTICPGEVLLINGFEYSAGGTFETLLTNIAGCDSTLTIELFAAPGIEEVILGDTIFAELGDYIDIIPSLSSDFTNIEWYNNSELVSNESSLVQLRPFDNTSYLLKVANEYGCIEERTIVVVVDKEVRTYIPTVISKGTPLNDAFIIGTNQAVESIQDLSIYDRWGELVYSYSGPVSEYRGWDGRFRGGYVEQGVYTYVANFLVVDGSQLMRSGTLTLIE